MVVLFPFFFSVSVLSPAPLLCCLPSQWQIFSLIRRSLSERESVFIRVRCAVFCELCSVFYML